MTIQQRNAIREAIGLPKSHIDIFTKLGNAFRYSNRCKDMTGVMKVEDEWWVTTPKGCARLARLGYKYLSELSIAKFYGK